MAMTRLNKKIISDLEKIREAALGLASLSSATKDRILASQAKALLKNSQLILKANKNDLIAARRKGLTSAFIDRITIDKTRIRKMSDSLRALIALADPVGRTIKRWRSPSGFMISKVSIPLGIILIIYESRPDVTCDSIGLCIKSGNAVVLRGGSEAIYTNRAIFKVLSSVLSDFSVNKAAINFVSSPQRKIVDLLLKKDKYIDVVIPRGGKGLIEKISRLSRIPVIKHYQGICHIYVDKYADLNMALNLCVNAKVQRPGTCNAMETMLIHQAIADKFLPMVIKTLFIKGVKIRACPRSLKIIRGHGLGHGPVRLVRDQDYFREYLDLILNVRIVPDLKAALTHINHYGSHHSDAIVSADKDNAEEFLRGVDSACVYHNVSTRFTDGYQFGMGAEMGISTDRLHARGPVALEELTTYKYMIRGKGQIRN